MLHEVHMPEHGGSAMSGYIQKTSSSMISLNHLKCSATGIADQPHVSGCFPTVLAPVLSQSLLRQISQVFVSRSADGGSGGRVPVIGAGALCRTLLALHEFIASAAIFRAAPPQATL